MKVELSIADDQELRQAIKDMIKGEIVHIAREEIKGIFAQVIGEKIIPVTEKQLKEMAEEQVRNHVVEHMTNKASWQNPTFLDTIIREEVRRILKDLLERGKLV